MHDPDRLAGIAALGLLETMLAVLVEKNVLGQDEADEILLDTADAFENAAEDGCPAEKRLVARLLERVQPGNDTLRA